MHKSPLKVGNAFFFSTAGQICAETRRDLGAQSAKFRYQIWVVFFFNSPILSPPLPPRAAQNSPSLCGGRGGRIWPTQLLKEGGFVPSCTGGAVMHAVRIELGEGGTYVTSKRRPPPSKRFRGLAKNCQRWKAVKNLFLWGGGEDF